jgi:MFS family permease
VSPRWLITAALFVVVFSVSNAIAAFGVFLPALAEAFGWSRGSISVALSMNLLFGGFFGFVVGAVADRHGPRAILLGTVGMAGAGFALASTVTALWQFYLFVGIMAGIGASGFYIIGAATVSRWFEHGRGLPLALVLAGFSVSFVTGGPIAAWLIERLGWRSAYLVFGGWLCLVGGLAALVVRNPPPSLPDASGTGTPAERRGLSVRAALADRRFWFFALSWLLSGAVSLMLSVHIVAYARDRGIGLASASLALTAYGLGSTLGRLAFGPLSDRLGQWAIVRVCFALQVIAVAVLSFSPSQEMLLAVLFAFGLGFTGADTVVVSVIPDVFGLRALGAIMGVLSLTWRIGAALGPALAGFAHDATGSYALPFAVAPVVLFLSYAFYALGASPRPRR